MPVAASSRHVYDSSVMNTVLNTFRNVFIQTNYISESAGSSCPSDSPEAVTALTMIWTAQLLHMQRWQRLLRCQVAKRHLVTVLPSVQDVCFWGSLQYFAPLIWGRQVLVKTDNHTTMGYTNKQGGVSSTAPLKLAENL